MRPETLAILAVVAVVILWAFAVRRMFRSCHRTLDRMIAANRKMLANPGGNRG